MTDRQQQPVQNKPDTPSTLVSVAVMLAFIAAVAAAKVKRGIARVR